MAGLILFGVSDLATYLTGKGINLSGGAVLCG